MPANPMGAGLEMDIETGEPVDLVRLSRASAEQERRARRIERYEALLDDLGGQGGEVVREVARQLAKRIDELIVADPVATALVAILQGVQVNMAYGARTTQQYLDALGLENT